MIDVRQLAKYSMHNKSSCMNASSCGCFHCLNIFNSSEIKEWTDDNDTAICPYCQTDAVLSETDGIIIDKELLEKAKKYWFLR